MNRVLSPSRQPSIGAGSCSEGTSNGHSAYFLLAVACVLLQGKRGFGRREARRLTDLVTRDGR